MDYLRNFWREVEPIFKHGIVAASVALVAAGLLKLFQMILPPDYAQDLHNIDHVLVVVLFWLFGGYTLALLLIRLGRHLYGELKPDTSKKRELQESSQSYIELESKDELVEDAIHSAKRSKSSR